MENMAGYAPESVLVDEEMVPFKGQLKIKVRRSDKPVK